MAPSVKMTTSKNYLAYFLIFLSLINVVKTGRILPDEYGRNRPNNMRRVPSSSTSNRTMAHRRQPHPSSNISARSDSGPQVYTSCSLAQSFALTFDDGPTNLSEELDKKLGALPDLKASYFINGNNFGCIYDQADILIRRFNQGNLIASHTWSHVHLNEGSYEQISRQVELLDQAMIKILGVKPLYFRPPFGEYNDIVLQVLREKGYKGLVLWSDDSGDSSASPLSPPELIKMYQTFPEKSIVLNHETHRFMVDDVLPSVLQDLKPKNYKLLPVTECLELGSSTQDWYKFVQSPGTRDDTWTCTGTPGPGQYE